MKKFACAALSTALLASMLAACGSSASTTPAASSADTSSDTGASSTEAAASTGAAADGSLHVAMNTDIQTMDVHKTNNDYMVPLNIFDRLFEIKTNADGSTELEKSLVEDYTVSDDGLTYDFTLRSGVTFSDGTPLTANDVKYTFTRMLALPDSVQTDYGSAIAGAEAVMDGTATDLEGIQVIDDTHFTVTLSDPFAGFLYELATSLVWTAPRPSALARMWSPAGPATAALCWMPTPTTGAKSPACSMWKFPSCRILPP